MLRVNHRHTSVCAYVYRTPARVFPAGSISISISQLTNAIFVSYYQFQAKNQDKQGFTSSTWQLGGV